MTVSVIGYGANGKFIHQLFKSAVVYDPNIADYCDLKNEVNDTDFSFVCVPVSPKKRGEIDISIVESVVKWVQAKIIIIKSTVPPGTSQYLKRKYNKSIVFWSDFNTDSRNHFSMRPCCLLGGSTVHTKEVLNLFSQHANLQKKFIQTSFEIAELSNYMATTWLAIQATFANEFYELAHVAGADLQEFLQVWTENSQISIWNKKLIKNERGFSDRNIQKNLRALISLAEENEIRSFFFDGINRANNFNIRKNDRQENVPEKTHNTDTIKFYQIDHPYGYFSNFSNHPVYLRNRIWATPEHYYQAQKFVDTPYEEEVRLASSPVKASRMGQNGKYPIRSDWGNIKNDVMRELIYAKFSQHPDLRKKLLETGDAVLIEHTANDDYWGDGIDGTGKNMLGKILMEVRSSLKQV